MTREREIEILRADRCTKSEAEAYMKRGTIVFTAEDFEGNFEGYMNEWFGDWDEEDREEEIANLRKMIETKEAPQDWGVVELEGETFYIEYVN